MRVQGFETKSVRMERLWLLQLFAPAEDVDRILEHVCKIVPLVQGSYDSNAFQSAAGVERYRPLAGAMAGAETELRRRPGVVEVSFELPVVEQVLKDVIETIYQVHSYQEPVVRVQEILSCRTKGLDDKMNPYRWWNTTGDWHATPSNGQ